MPTLPAENEPHRHRQVAESFGTDAERYDRTRPHYPSALVERVVAASPGPDVLDVGCGTGIAARQLALAGCRVLGVDPDARMADFARHTGVAVEVATFETWDQGSRRFDAVVAGQTWHWVDPVAGAAKAAHALRPSGLLAVFWHVFQPPDAVAEAFAAVFERVAPDAPFDVRAARTPSDTYQAMCARAAEGIREVERFAEPEQWRYDWEQRYTTDEWLDLLPTQGHLTRLPQDQLTEVLTDVGAAVDDLGGSFTMPYTTVAVAATRLPSA